MKKLFLFAMMLSLAAGLGGCAERDQVVEAKPGDKYQGKRDGKPWDNDPLGTANAGKWTKGDRASWETQIKARQLGQHEDKRIYQ